MSTPLGPGSGSQTRLIVKNTGAAIPAGYAVELDTGAIFAATKYLPDSVSYDVICVQLVSGNNLVLGIAPEAIGADEYGEIVTYGLVKAHADDTIVIEDPVVVISGGKLDNEGGTGVHSDAYYGQWLEAVVAEKRGLIFFWASPLPRIAT